MEKLEAFDSANLFIASYYTDDRVCAHCNREHTLIYLHSGELEITDGNRKTMLRPGDCAFLRRDNMMWLQKKMSQGKPYRSVVMKFSREYLKDYFQRLDRREVPMSARRDKSSHLVFGQERADLTTLFESVLPIFDSQSAPSTEELRSIMDRGMKAILTTDPNLYASLFDFYEPWKIDIVDFMEKNYMNDLSMEEIAYYTGRSLATFKRDFKKVSDLTPQKWLIRRRLMAAREMIRTGGRKVSEICFEVGFKNLSHFSKIYKELFGTVPTAKII